MVKAMNRLHHKKETPAPDVPSAPSAETLLAEIRDGKKYDLKLAYHTTLLAEIRDLLKEQTVSGPSAAAPEKEV